MKEHVFEIFSQGPSITGRSLRGLGLGLPLVKSLVEAHGGDLKLFSEGENQGSEFQITLPRLSPELDSDTAEGAGEQPTSGGHIEYSLLTMCQMPLSPWRYCCADMGIVRRAEDGPTALNQMLTIKPDIALLDIGLPGMDGYEVARRLRSELSDIRLTAVTGYAFRFRALVLRSERKTFMQTLPPH